MQDAKLVEGRGLGFPVDALPASFREVWGLRARGLRGGGFFCGFSRARVRENQPPFGRFEGMSLLSPAGMGYRRLVVVLCKTHQKPRLPSGGF